MKLSIGEENLQLRAEVAWAKERIRELEEALKSTNVLDLELTKKMQPKHRKLLTILVNTYPSFIHRERLFSLLATNAADDKVVDVMLSILRRKHGVLIESRNGEGWRFASLEEKMRWMRKAGTTFPNDTTAPV